MALCEASPPPRLNPVPAAGGAVEPSVSPAAVVGWGVEPRPNEVVGVPNEKPPPGAVLWAGVPKEKPPPELVLG